MISNIDIVCVARSYKDTPFHHRGRLPGVALDCVGVPICASRQLGTVKPDFDVPPYTPTPDGHTMLEWCVKHLIRVSKQEMQPGNMVVIEVDKDPQHIGILGDYLHGGLSIIHASNSLGAQRVIETRLMFSRIMRFVAAFSLLRIS